MISIITCSVNPTFCQQMIESVKETINVAFETIVFDNRDKKWGICKVYNYCARKAKYPYLCFIHEDIFIVAENWGKAMIEFTDRMPKCGVIGFAGGRSVPRFFYGWGGDVRCRYYEEIPDTYDKPSPEETKCYKSRYYKYRYRNPDNEIWSEVLTLDGIFLFCEKNVWKKNPFDEYKLSGFHCYDADFTFSIAQSYQNYVYLGGDIYHYSNGDLGRTWSDAIFVFQNKWKDKTPYNLGKDKPESYKHVYNDIATVYNFGKKHSVPFLERCLRIKMVGGWTIFLSFLPLYFIAHNFYRFKHFLINIWKKI